MNQPTAKAPSAEDVAAAVEVLIRAVAARVAITQTDPPATGADSVQPDRLLSVKAVATALGTGTSYVYDLVNAGDLPVVQLGRSDRKKYRVRESVLTEWSTQHELRMGRRRRRVV